MKQNRTKHVYFSFFNPLKMKGARDLRNLKWVLKGCEFGESIGCENKKHSFVEVLDPNKRAIIITAAQSFRFQIEKS